ncbi:MAG: hypothetical protein ABH877_04570 [bacterium]
MRSRRERQLRVNLKLCRPVWLVEIDGKMLSDSGGAIRIFDDEDKADEALWKAEGEFEGDGRLAKAVLVYPVD